MSATASGLPRGATGPAASSPGVELPSEAGFQLVTGRRIYILPTRQGFAFGGMLIVMLLGSANYDNGLGYALVFLLSSLGLVSLVHTYRNLAGLKVRVSAGSPVFAGSRSAFQVTIDNRGGQPRPAVVLRLRPAVQPGVTQTSPEPGPRRWYLLGLRRRNRPAPPHERDVIVNADLEGDAITRLEGAVPAAVRGWLELERIVLASRYPFGLFRAWSVPAFPVRALIWPRAEGREPMPLSGGTGRLESGEHAKGDEDFAGLREYARGDAPNRIHWKALARGQGVQVKQFSGGAPSEVELDIADTVGHTEARISQLTRWVLDADASGHRFTLVLGGQRLGPDNGRAHREQALAALALYQLPGKTGPDGAGSGAWTGGV